MMIKLLELTNFMRHNTTRLEFPERGVVLVTGMNGSGKSTIAEAVAWALWGETLRKKPPYRKDVSAKAPCIASVTTYDGVTVDRHRKGATTKLDWRGAEEPVKSMSLQEFAGFATTTKAQDSLESLIGSFDTWRASHAFSSSDASRLTQATDKERKLLLENLAFNGSKFDAALQRCRAEQKTVLAKLNEMTLKLARAQERLAAAHQRREAAEAILASLPESVPVGDSTRVAELKAAERVLVEEVRDMREGAQRASGVTSRGDGELGVLQRQLSKLGDTGNCDACGQPVPTALVAGLKSKIAARQAALNASKLAADEEAEGYKQSAKDAESRLQQLRSQLTTFEAELRRSSQVSTARATNEAEIAKATSAVKEAQELLEEAQREVPSLQKEQAVLDAVELVLGLRGVRAAILAKTLKSIELAINAWLPRLAGAHLKVRLTSSHETKAGTISDAIGFEVDGAGEGYGYQASSGGERRRIDIAVLLALSDVACATRGKTPGTLFLDEVLDALDEEGVEAVAQVLQELGKERPVVVVSHNQELAMRLPGAVRWHVVAGKVN